MRTVGAIALLLATPAAAQNNFQTPGGASVPGYVTMCVVGGKAVPCSPTVSNTDAIDRIVAEIDALRAEVLKLKCGTAGAAPC